MSKNVHHITITVFEKNEANIEQIHSTFRKLLPLDNEKEKIELIHDTVQGFFQKTIHIFRLHTSKKRHNKLLMTSFFEKLSDDDKEKIIKQIELRVDDQGHFFIRFDKSILINDSFVLTDSGDCFHMKIKLAAFPATKEGFYNSAKELMYQYMD